MNALNTIGEEVIAAHERGLNSNKDISLSHDRAPKAHYTWKTGKTFFLSRKETLVAETYLKTRSFAECSRALKGIGVNRSPLTCRRWLERSHVREWVEEQFEERGMAEGWTKERWLAVMTRHIKGEVRLANGDLYGMNLIARVKGFEVPQGMGSVTQINFMEKA